MPQYKRVGHDFTMELDNPNPEFWEPVEVTKTATKAPAPAEAPAEESKE
jgi:hypothetical protein